jgi:tRNA(fMet)-specific endonuclease VapC
MNGNILLDTNIVIALFANEVSIINNLRKVEEIFIPCIVVGELFFGALKSEKVNDNLSRLNEFASHNIILGCDIDTAFRYGQI